MSKKDDIDILKLLNNIGKFIDEVGKVLMKTYKWVKEKYNGYSSKKTDSGWS